MFKKAKIIFDGWKNYTIKSDVIESIAKERAGICGGCSHAKKETILTLIKDDFKEVEGYVCGLCACPLSAKIRSNDKCYLWKK